MNPETFLRRLIFDYVDENSREWPDGNYIPDLYHAEVRGVPVTGTGSTKNQAMIDLIENLFQWINQWILEKMQSKTNIQSLPVSDTEKNIKEVMHENISSL